MYDLTKQHKQKLYSQHITITISYHLSIYHAKCCYYAKSEPLFSWQSTLNPDIQNFNNILSCSCAPITCSNLSISSFCRVQPTFVNKNIRFTLLQYQTHMSPYQSTTIISIQQVSQNYYAPAPQGLGKGALKWSAVSVRLSHAST